MQFASECRDSSEIPTGLLVAMTDFKLPIGRTPVHNLRNTTRETIFTTALQFEGVRLPVRTGGEIKPAFWDTSTQRKQVCFRDTLAGASCLYAGLISAPSGKSVRSSALFSADEQVGWRAESSISL